VPDIVSSTVFERRAQYVDDRPLRQNWIGGHGQSGWVDLQLKSGGGSNRHWLIDGSENQRAKIKLNALNVSFAAFGVRQEHKIVDQRGNVICLGNNSRSILVNPRRQAGLSKKKLPKSFDGGDGCPKIMRQKRNQI
jgi:hypothetical protein